MYLISYQNEMRNIDLHNRTRHKRCRIRQKTLRSTFKHNVPFENVATVSPTSHPQLEKWRKQRFEPGEYLAVGGSLANTQKLKNDVESGCRWLYLNPESPKNTAEN